jgi:hypothetical protein
MKYFHRCAQQRKADKESRSGALNCPGQHHSFSKNGTNFAAAGDVSHAQAT